MTLTMTGENEEKRMETGTEAGRNLHNHLGLDSPSTNLLCKTRRLRRETTASPEGRGPGWAPRRALSPSAALRGSRAGNRSVGAGGGLVGGDALAGG